MVSSTYENNSYRMLDIVFSEEFIYLLRAI